MLMHAPDDSEVGELVVVVLIVVVQEADYLARGCETDGAGLEDTWVKAQVLCIADRFGLLGVDPGAMVDRAAVDGHEAVVVCEVDHDDVHQMLGMAFYGMFGSY